MMITHTARTIAEQIADLGTMATHDLVRRWTELYGVPPVIVIRTYLRNRLSYRLQELMLGGLSKQSRELMEGMLDEAGADSLGMIRRKRRSGPVKGTRLIREWAGEVHEVLVTGRGYEYRDRVYSSLTSVAKMITRQSWNGNEFFGLTKRRTRDADQ